MVLNNSPHSLMPKPHDPNPKPPPPKVKRPTMAEKAARVADVLRGGKVLMKTKASWTYDPGGQPVTFPVIRYLIEKGMIVENDDRLFLDDVAYSQTWRLADGR